MWRLLSHPVLSIAGNVSFLVTVIPLAAAVVVAVVGRVIDEPALFVVAVGLGVLGLTLLVFIAVRQHWSPESAEHPPGPPRFAFGPGDLARAHTTAGGAPVRRPSSVVSRPPKLSLGRVHIPRHAQQVVIDPDAHPLIHPMGRVLRVPVINEQGAGTARAVQALLHFLPDDVQGAFSPRHPALAEWDTEPSTTSIEIPGNGQPHLFNVALVLNQGHPCVFEWTPHSRDAQLNGFGIAGPGIIKVEVKGSGDGKQAPTASDTLRIEAHTQIVKANWDSAGADEGDNWVPK